MPESADMPNLFIQMSGPLRIRGSGHRAARHNPGRPRMRKTLFVALSSAVLSLVAITGAQAQTDPGTIVEVASANPDFSTLVTALKAAELVDTLSGPGPFTVFAPTNAAFEKLPAGTLDKLLADPKGALTDVLKLHVISGSVDAAAATAAAGTEVETLGGKVAVAKDGEALTIGGAKIVTTDIKASNGIIHVIDAVITAPASAAATTETTVAATEETVAPTPTEVATGDDGLAASSTSNSGLVLTLGGAALLGIIASSTVLVRARSRSRLND